MRRAAQTSKFTGQTLELEGVWSVAIIGKISLEEVKSKLKGKDGRVVGV